MTEIRYEEFLPLSVYQDKLASIFYVKILSPEKCYTIKIGRDTSTQIPQIIHPFVISKVELIKTAKNWILKEVINQKRLIEPITFEEYDKLARAQIILNSLIKENQTTNLYHKILSFLQRNKDFNLIDFENYALINLGFANPDINQESKEKLHQSKSANNLFT
jgi:hypothetical protein